MQHERVVNRYAGRHAEVFDLANRWRANVDHVTSFTPTGTRTLEAIARDARGAVTTDRLEVTCNEREH